MGSVSICRCSLCRVILSTQRKVLYIIKEKKVTKRISFQLPSCRDEATRTPDPYVPNVVRYQLRYIPLSNHQTDRKYTEKLPTMYKRSQQFAVNDIFFLFLRADIN